MPSLNVAAVARMNSCSSICSSLWKTRIGGMVASPTPMVPISSDSMSVISSNEPSWCDSAAAASQPAVPPPAMTTFFTDLESTLPLRASTIQAVQEHGPDLPRAVFIDGSEQAAGLLRKMFARARRRAEHVILENLPPGFLLRLRPVAYRPYGVIERTHW